MCLLCACSDLISSLHRKKNQREEKDKRYKCGNINSQDFPNPKGCQHQGPNSQRQPTISQKLPVSIIYTLLRHRNLQLQPLASIYHLILLLTLQPQLFIKVSLLFELKRSCFSSLDFSLVSSAIQVSSSAINYARSSSSFSILASSAMHASSSDFRF